MAENVYRGYKEDQGGVSTGAERIFRADPGASVRRRTVARRARPFRHSPTTPEDYLALKATWAAAVQDIRLEVRGQHEQIRALVRDQHEQTRDEVQSTRRDLLDAIKSSPAECLKLVSEFGSLFLLFSLAIRFTLNIDLVNPAFALFMLFAFALYWGMAQLKQGSKKVRKEEA